MSAPTVLAYGDRALLVELEHTDRVVAWAQALREQPLPGVVDLVPAAATLLVMVDEGADVTAVRRGLEGLTVEGTSSEDAEDGDVVEIAVTYDGPDLADVAELTGLSEREVVERTPEPPGGSPSVGSPRASATSSAGTPAWRCRDATGPGPRCRPARSAWQGSSAASTRGSPPAGGS